MLAIHNCPKQANLFIRQCLQYSDCEVFIHIDKKARDIEKDLIIDNRIHILPYSYSVNWGDYSQVQYVLYMMRYIQAYKSFDYYSLHTGNDLLVRPMQELAAYLEKDNKYAYLDCYPLPWDQWQYGGGLGRLEMVWPIWMRKRLKPHSLKRYLRALYGRLYVIPFLRRRKLPCGVQFYGKSAFYTLRQDCVSDIINYNDEHPEFSNFFKPVLCGDEIFVDTIAHITAAENKIIDDHNNLRYDDFMTVNRVTVGAPKILTTEDIKAIEKSGMFFARKFDYNVDNNVIQYFINKSMSYQEV